MASTCRAIGQSPAVSEGTMPVATTVSPSAMIWLTLEN